MATPAEVEEFEFRRRREQEATRQPVQAAAVVTPAATGKKTLTPQQAYASISPVAGLAEPIAGMMSQSILGPLSGYLGALKFGSTEGTMQEKAAAAATRVHGIQALGYKPRVETAATGLLEKAAPTLEKVAQWADDQFYALAGGHPALASTFKTTVDGALSIIGAGRLKPIAKIANIKAGEKMMETNLEGLASIGVAEQKGGWKSTAVPNPGDIPDATIRAAKNIAGDPRRGAMLEDTLKRLADAKKASKGAMDSSWKAFRDQHGNVEVDGKPFAALEQNIRKSLIEKGFDLENSPRTSKLLDDIKNLSVSKTPTEFNHVTGQPMFPDKAMATVRDIDILRRRASTKAVARAATPDEAALGEIRKQMEDSLDNIFENSAKEVGKSIATGKGDELKVRNMVRSWTEARSNSVDYYKKFAGPLSAHKQVTKLLRDSATPEDVWSYVVGASALTNKLGGVNVIQHIKKILGDTSPAITDLRQAAVRDIMSPLTGDQYDFGKLVKNVDYAINNKYSLLKELGIDKKQLLNVRKAAIISQEMMKRNPQKFDARYITASTGALTFGNSLAHNMAILRLYKRVVGNRLNDVESKMTLKDMLRKGPDVPIVQSSPEALDWLAATAAGNIPDAVTSEDE